MLYPIYVYIFTEATAHWYSINMGQIESAYTSTTEIIFLFKEQKHCPSGNRAHGFRRMYFPKAKLVAMFIIFSISIYNNRLRFILPVIS